LQPSTNFQFLKPYDPIFLQLATVAEQMYHSDPNTTLVKLRQFAEALAQEIASHLGIEPYEYEDQYQLLALLDEQRALPYRIRDLFHTLRKEGNRAVHRFSTNHQQALKALKNAHKLSQWYHGMYGNDEKVVIKPFTVPVDPSKRLQKIHADYERLKAKLLEKKEKLEESKELAELRMQEQQEYDELIENMKREKEAQKAFIAEQEAEFEAEKRSFEAKITELSCSISNDEREKLSQIYAKRGDDALCHIALDEDETLEMIDLKLNEVGWESDNTVLDYQKGARPSERTNRAISHWECRDAEGNRSDADYVLFISLKPVAIIFVTPNSAKIEIGIAKAEILSRDINLQAVRDIAQNESYELVLDEWYRDALEKERYRVPMVYASNGREYHPERKEQSGIWFRDLRRLENKARQILQWFSPEEIAEFLDRNDENLVFPIEPL
jgi:type I restriction enzyme R subunit